MKGTLLKFALIFAAGVAVIAVGWGWLEYVTLSNDVPDDHITAVVGRFVIEQPWAALAIALLATNPISFALGVLVGHIGEDAKRWVKGARVPVLLLAALAAGGCKSLSDAADRIAQDPSRLCPPNHVLTAQGCVERPSEVAKPSPAPPITEPTPAMPPTPVEPGPTPVGPEPTPAPSPGPTPAPPPRPQPTATPKPTPNACARDCAWQLERDQQNGHIVLYQTLENGTKVYCNDATGAQNCYRSGDCAHVTKDGGFLHSACEWLGMQACCEAPAPPPAPVPTPTSPAPGPAGAYSCGGITAARIGINFNKAPTSSPDCTFDKTTLRAEGDCIIVADASVRGPRGSAPDVPSTEAHLGWLPGCHWVVRPRWEQIDGGRDPVSGDPFAVDLGVRHWLDDGSTNARPSWELGDYPPYGAQPFGSLGRFEFDRSFAGSTVQLRACWPPDVPDPVCSPWYEVTHR